MARLLVLGFGMNGDGFFSAIFQLTLLCHAALLRTPVMGKVPKELHKYSPLAGRSSRTGLSAGRSRELWMCRVRAGRARTSPPPGCRLRTTAPVVPRGPPPVRRYAIGSPGAARQWGPAMLAGAGKGEVLLGAGGEASPAAAPPAWGAARAATAAGRCPSGWTNGSKSGCCRASG